jgi:hypothetical protein
VTGRKEELFAAAACFILSPFSNTTPETTFVLFMAERDMNSAHFDSMFFSVRWIVIFYISRNHRLQLPELFLLFS